MTTRGDDQGAASAPVAPGIRLRSLLPSRRELPAALMGLAGAALGMLILADGGADAVFGWGMTGAGLGAAAGVRVPVLRKHLFNSWYNSLATILIAAVAVYASYRGGKFLFASGQWEAVRTNLTLLMIGTFPRGELWRLVTQTYLLASAIGIAWGASVAASRDRGADIGVRPPRDSLGGLARRYWPILLLLVVILAFTRTIWPTLLCLSAVALGMSFRAAVLRMPRRFRPLSWYTAGACGIASFQVLTGTGGISWWWTSALAALVAMRFIASRDFAQYEGTELTIFRRSSPRSSSSGPGSRRAVGRAAAARRNSPRIMTAKRLTRYQLAAQITAVAAAVVAVRVVYWLIGDTSGVGWDDWSGLHLTLVASAAAIILALPLSLLLALGRRSSLPVVRWLCVGFIELFRGLPLITLLFVASLFIGFFLDTDTPLSLMTRAIIMFTLFSSAYLAEVVRGGLQAVSRGQVEAGQAVGLPPQGVTRLIVLPQALRAVIPAMVGQLISLFKDSSLLSIISIVELVRARELIHAQTGFITSAHAETLVFVAFAYWAISYTMSRESQRLERRLGVGER